MRSMYEGRRSDANVPRLGVHDEVVQWRKRVEAFDPALFIGSSTEGLAVARALHIEADRWCEPTVWSQGVFEPGGTTIGDLLAAVENSDFAALVLTPDDSLVTRGDSIPVARDNVIFELGLFMGALGPRRVFIILPRDQNLSLPSDLAGVTVLDYRHNRRDGNLRAAIGPAATVIHGRIAAEGSRSGRDASARIASTRPPWTGTTINEPKELPKTPEELGDIGKWRQVDHLADQMYQWPELTEQYPRYDVYVGHTQREGLVYISLGWTKRAGAWGRNRIYVVAFLSRRSPQTPLVEFLETDDHAETDDLLAVVRGRDGGRRMYGPEDTLPAVYAKCFRTEIYRDRIHAPGAWNKFAVVAHKDDTTAILNHALLQARRRGDL